MRTGSRWLNPRRVFVGGVVLLTAGSAGWLNTALAGAETDQLTSGEFAVAARADAWRVTVVDPSAPGFPAGEAAVENSPASAQTVLDSLGTSAGFASAPYPGDFAVAAPGTVNGVGSGSIPPVPDYPFIVNSSYPGVPAAEQTNGPYSIRSTSTESGSKADAHIALTYGSPSIGSAQATSNAIRDVDTGNVTAEADSAVYGFSLGPILTLGEISGHARVVAAPGGKPVKESFFSVGSVTIAGVTVGFGNKGIQPGQGTLPGQNLALMTEQLQQAGITLTYLPASETDTSVNSAGLAVNVVHDVPTRGKVNTTFVFGRVRALAQAGAALPGDSEEEPADLVGGDVTDSDASPPAADADVSSDYGLTPLVGGSDLAEGLSAPYAQDMGATSLGFSGSLGASRDGFLGASRDAPAQSGPRAALKGSPATAFSPLVGQQSEGVFLALIGVSVVLLAGSWLFGSLGVRLLFGTAGQVATQSTASVLRLPAG